MSTGWCVATETLMPQQRCNCRQYREADTPQAGQPLVCLECLHGRSLHTGEPKVIKESKSIDAKSILGSLIVGGYVPTQRATATFEAAQKEANDGLRKKEGSSNDTKPKSKGKASHLHHSYAYLLILIWNRCAEKGIRSG
jgi:hypothetical protein